MSNVTTWYVITNVCLVRRDREGVDEKVMMEPTSTWHVSGCPSSIFLLQGETFGGLLIADILEEGLTALEVA